MINNPIRIGVMGCANIAQRTMLNKFIQAPQFELVAVASRSLDKSKLVANKFNCEAIQGYMNLINRDDISAIYMPLPTGLHEEWVMKSLNRNKHVFVEKSFGRNYKETSNMIELAKSKNLVVMENFMFLYHKQHKFVEEVISSGEIGEIRCFRSSFGFPPLDEESFRYNKALGGGSLLDAGAYTVRAAQLILGPSLEVSSSFLKRNESGVDIYGGAQLVNPKGHLAQVAFGFDNFYQCNYEIWGAKGKITAHKAFTPNAEFKPVITVEKHGFSKDYVTDSDDHFRNIIFSFGQKIRKTNKLNLHYDEILNQSALLDEIILKDLSAKNTNA